MTFAQWLDSVDETWKIGPELYQSKIMSSNCVLQVNLIKFAYPSFLDHSYLCFETVFLTNEIVKIYNYKLKNTHFSITLQPFTSTMYYK